MQNYIGSLLSNIAYLNLDSTNFQNGKLTIAGMNNATLNKSDMLFFNEYFTMKEQSPESDLFTGSVITNDKDLILGDSTIMKKDTVSIAYRGTQESDDWLTDIGLAYDSSVSLYKDLNLLTVKLKDGEIDFENIDMNDILLRINNFGSNSSLSLIAGQRQDALNYFNMVQNKYSSNDINLYGHSLGGYLANYVTVMGQNNQNINETITYNAPGFSTTQIIIMQIAALITQFKEYSNSEQISVELQNSLNEIISSIDLKFNISSLDKLNSIYSTRGIEFTSSDVLGMAHPELRYPLYTDPSWNTHSIVGLREILCAYDSLSCFMPGGSTLKNYEYITKIIEGFSKHLGFDSNFRAGDEILNQISKFIGIPSTTGIDVLTYVNSLPNINQYTFKRTDESSYMDISSGGNEILYSLINYIPFTITGANQIKDDKYNPEKYTKETIDARFKLFNDIMSLKGNDINTVSSSINNFKDYKIFFNDKNQNNFLYIDTVNKLMYTNDLNVIVDANAAILNKNLETTYFKDNGSLIVNTFNNIIYDHYSSDHITLNKGETVLYLSYGNDTINIDSGAGAIIKDLTIEDDGLGDLFIFNGGNNVDFIKGTKYTDKIIGYEGNDHLFGGDGNDTIMGDEGDDMIFGENGDDILIGGDGNDMLMGGAGSNYLSGGAGNDLLNAFNTPTEYHDIRGDTLDGGTGKNTLIGTGYGDRYVYSGGFDTIYEKDKNFGVNYVDKLIFSSNIQTSQVSLYNSLNNLVIAINGIWQIFVIDYYNNNYSYLDEIQFTNPISGYKTIWDTNYILQNTINPPGSNMIIGSDNSETITGTDADNIIDGRDGNDVINGGKGNDIIYGGNGNDTINGGIGNDEIHGGSGDDILNGNEGNDTIHGDDGNDKINGDLGIDLIYGGNGNDTINGGNSEIDTIYGGDGNDIINKSQTYTNDIVIGGKGNDEIYGAMGNDKYHYTSGDGNDTITATTTDGVDTLYLHDISPDDVEIYRQGINYNDIYITIKSTGESIIIKNYYQSMSTIGYLDEIVFDNGVAWKSDKIIDQAKYYRGTEGNETIKISNSLINIIDSYGGDDIIVNQIKGTTINSGDGADFINSSGADAIINTGNGGDTIIVSGNNITIESGSGGDTIRSTMSGIINAGLDNDKIDLGSLKETIIYNIGDGTDTVNTTGAGGDVFNINGYNKIDLNNIFLSGQGKIVELRFNGTDSIKLINYINLLANMNNSMTFNFNDGSLNNNELKDLYTIITKAEAADNKFYDTIFSDQITGTNDNDNINIINGNGGNGFDTVNSGNGIDTITNKIDNTVINAGNDGDTIYTSGKNVTVYGDAGDDKIYISSTYIGSGYLNGGEGKDTINFLSNSASSNNYVIEGGLGNDTISMSKAIETIIFNKNDGVDTINISGTNADSQSDRLIIRGYSKNIITAENFILYDDGTSVTLKLSENDNIKLVNFLSGKIASNNLKYFEFDDGTLTSQDLIEKISQIKGTAGNDIIYDTAFNDTIDLSNGGDDTVYLRSGNDLLTTSNKSTRINVKSSYNTINSGNGDDKFFVEYDSINTFNLKSSNNGHDAISLGYIGKGSIVYVNISTTINIADTSVSGTGYKFSWGNDSSIHVSTSYVNKQVIFNYGIINYDDINLVGDDGDNYLSAISSKGQTIYGNGGKDTIYGSINDDIIYGGLGNDMLYGKGGDDKIYGEYGDDRIEDLDGNNFISGGEGNDSIYAGGGNDIIYGGDGNDQLNGGGGIDVIYGGDGNDSIYGTGEFYGGNGDDSYHISSGQISDYSGVNSLYFGRHYTAKVDLVSTGNGFNVFINGEHKISYSGNVNRIESKATPPDGYSYKLSLVGTEINRLFEIEAALESETDTSKITEMNREISNLWKYDQP